MCLSICLSVCLSVGLSVCLSVCVSVCLLVCLCVCVCMLLLFHNSAWLQAQRSQFVPAWGSASTRNSVLAGRTGTRANGGRPQQRWDAGICLAQAFLRSRRGSLANSHALSVSSRIRNAIREIYEFFNFADLEPG